jgi:seryl-tRNA synthetase
VRQGVRRDRLIAVVPLAAGEPEQVRLARLLAPPLEEHLPRVRVVRLVVLGHSHPARQIRHVEAAAGVDLHARRLDRRRQPHEELLEPLGYREMIFPKLVTWEVWMKSGHAKGVYPEIYYVCPPQTRDPEYWEEVADYYKVTHEVPTKLIKEKIAEPIGGMAYAQCPPFWMYVTGETLPNEEIPVKVFDRSGTSHRYESGGIHGIERVDEFHRIEIVWIGTKEEVIKCADELHERYMHIFNDILDIEWRKARVTPWFMAQEGLLGLAEENTVGTTDYEACLPYRGPDGEWLEFQNVSINGDKYPKGFNVKLQSGEELWSGCSGVGLERWAAVFLAQKGLDPANWPEEFRKRVGEMPKGIRFL